MQPLFRWAFLLLLLIGPGTATLWAQRDTVIQDDPPLNTDIIEDFVQGSEEEVSFDFNTLFEELQGYLNEPLNLNKATREELESLQLLSDIQINDLLQYRNRLGKLIAIYELQAIPSFDLNTIQRLLPYVDVDVNINDYQVPLGQLLKGGNNELFLRWGRILEQQRGFETDTTGTLSRFLGDPNQLYARYRYFYSNRFSAGITAEKDAGEEFFTGSNKRGFDFYSAHLFLNNYSHRFKSIALGDYQISLGQGLILFSGFGRGKSSQVMNIKRSQRTLRPYTSVDENNFMRGAAATLRAGDNLELTLFGSRQQRDGNLVDADLIPNEDIIRTLTSLQLSGLHRTEREIEDEDAITLYSVGGSLKYKTETWHLALNGLYNQLNQELIRTPRPYNRFFFNGDRLLNVSLDYSYIYRNYNFFGETAISDNGAIATVNGLLLGLDRKIDLALLYRSFAIDYQALNPNPFAETSGARNENGLYIGAEIRPLPHWRISAYFDTYRHPWLRFTADAPSRGFDYRVRLTYFRKRKLEAYVELRDETKQINASGNLSATDFLVDSRLLQLRIHFSNKISKELELRSRFDTGFFDPGTGVERSRGTVLYQDVIYRPSAIPFSFSTRFALFDTDGYNIRYYAFENDLVNTFSIPAYYNKGTRFYFNLRYRGIRKLSIEARYAQTYWANQDFFSSGLALIDGPQRSDVRVQLIYKW